ncbi:unknown [Bovine gammaherpesvirus 4]|uniref:Uncharacterized protein ORF 58 n=2 Tax=Bovine herpesvirus 4 TaxID=10385 RepID=A0A858PWW0_BHV4|nr:unknown [Bovine gammaherpesvirus 4]AAK07977.1 unknown [Bovine gammaherpesvirus 4]AEL29802.1 hypothetical protein [Bovine gammaherpesvirus 4]AIA82803.1 hypothetical protein [Bovine gammaherpesvirus 4]QJC19105.1 hypothetical protein [Bovine gammaherpesvirus 4]QJC19180.1 hypothetical protein [Bovine gammaherpesvirus 4]
MGKWWLNAASMVCGAMAATPFVWCFIFMSRFPLAAFVNWESHIYYDISIFLSQISLLGLCLVRCFHVINKCLELICTVVIICIFFVFFLSYVEVDWSVEAPLLFMIILGGLTVYPLITFDCVFLCSNMTQNFYELGFLYVILFYQLIISREVYSFFLHVTPLAIFICGGLYCLRSIQRSTHYKEALEKRKSIFITPSKYFYYSLGDVCASINGNLVSLTCCVVGVVLCLTSLHLYTTCLKGLYSYLFVFCSASLWCHGMSPPSRAMTWVYGLLGCCATILIHIFKNSLDMYTTGCMVVDLLLMFSQAIGCEIALVQRCLSGGLNGPQISFTLCVLCDVIIGITLYVINKI